MKSWCFPSGTSADISALDDDERSALADILKSVTSRYDSLFQVPCPYSMGFHQRPTDEQEDEEWHFHAHFFPPLLRSATVRKFMVGFEMLGSPQRDITPEYAADKLREAKLEPSPHDQTTPCSDRLCTTDYSEQPAMPTLSQSPQRIDSAEDDIRCASECGTSSSGRRPVSP